MKGISHFTSAIATATFVPGVVSLAANEHSLLLVMAGVFGLLPDWLDFKIARYFEPADEDVEPRVPDFNAQEMADRVTAAMRRAFDEDDAITIQLHSAQFGPDRWQKYSIQFDVEHNQVLIRPGPAINSGGFAVGTHGDPGPVGRALVGPKIRYTYDGEMWVETMEGPSFEFSKTFSEGRPGDEALEISFLPWHRRWSHSLVLAALFGLVVGALFGAPAGWVAAVAFATHVLEDQLGHLGSNLWWPFTGRRGAGLRLMHSGDPLPNFATVFTACGLILYNLNRFAAPPLFEGNVFLLWAVLVPAIASLMLYAAGHRRQPSPRPEAAREREALSETEETEVD
jgi:membrane-bound metal-dependent hydrolase YbcI (DUF457 family)